MLQEKVKRSYDKVIMSKACEEQIKNAIRKKSDSRSKAKNIYRYIPKPIAACALAVGAVLLVNGTVYAYTGNGIISYFFSFAQNAVFTRQTDENGTESASASFHTSEATAPAAYADGRLVFTANGERIDITARVSESKAFTYTYVDTEKMTHYFIVGGEPEEFGYAEFMKDADNNWIGGYFQGGAVGGDINPVWLEDAKDLLNIPW